MGQFWAADYDLDVVAELLSGEAVFGECKWWGEPVCMNVLAKLEQSASRSAFGGKGTPEKGTPRLMLFSRTGFNMGIKRIAHGGAEVYLIEPKHYFEEYRQAQYRR